MPEGPEIRRAADRVEATVGGRIAREVVFTIPRLRSAGEALSGRVVTRVETVGKAMLTWFDDEVAVYSHNQLYGRWLVRKTDATPKTRRAIRLSIHTDGGSAHLLSATDVEILDRDTLYLHPFLAKLGPDPLHTSTRARTIRRQLEDDAFRRRQLAGLLLDQSFVAGLGNYLRSEILFVAGAHPKDRPDDLDDDGRRALAAAIRAITRRAYRSAGVTLDAKRVKALKAEGASRRAYRHFVFGRAGLPCRVCGARIVRETLAGRRLYRCPTCQPRRA